MKAIKREKRLLRLVYLLCLLLFTALGFLQQPFDKFALIMGVVLCVLIGYSHFVIRRFYPDGSIPQYCHNHWWPAARAPAG